MKEQSFASIALKTIVVHTVTYFLVGLFAFTLLDYTGKYADPSVANLMRHTSDPLVAGGTLFQVLRGFLFGLVFYSLREIVFARKNGWPVLWLTLMVVGILSPFGAAPSSIEGMVYTRLPMWFHIAGLPEVIIQAFLLAFLTYYWVNHPEKKWIGWIFVVAFVLAVLMSTMGLLAGLGILQKPT
jgi:hypothetical protein